MIENYMVAEDEPDKVYRCESCGAILTQVELDAGLDKCSVCEMANK